jgi:hypothetical protein
LIHHRLVKPAADQQDRNDMIRPAPTVPSWFIVLAICSLARSAPAHAGSITDTNVTAITAYDGASPTPYFGGANPYVAQGPIGTEFETASLTLSAVSTGAGIVLDLRYVTRFSGYEVLNGIAIANADIFLGNGGGSATSPFGYAIALGDQAQNAGLAAGFYSVGQVETSQAIWQSRPQFVYGGAFGSSAAMEPGQAGYSAAAAPTVLTAGTRLGGAVITETELASGWYQLDAQITLTAAEAAYFGNGMDVFWGTGDCANGSFMADFSSLPMPEPCSAAMLAAGVFYMLMRRRGGAPSDGFGVQRIAGRAHGANHIELGVAVNGFTQPPDMHVDSTRLDMNVRSPHRVQ